MYLPSEEFSDLKGKTKQSKISISKFVIEHIKNLLQSELYQPSFETRVNLIKQNKDLQKQWMKSISMEYNLSMIY